MFAFPGEALCEPITVRPDPTQHSRSPPVPSSQPSSSSTRTSSPPLLSSLLVPLTALLDDVSAHSLCMINWPERPSAYVHTHSPRFSQSSRPTPQRTVRVRNITQTGPRWSDHTASHPLEVHVSCSARASPGSQRALVFPLRDASSDDGSTRTPQHELPPRSTYTVPLTSLPPTRRLPGSAPQQQQQRGEQVDARGGDEGPCEVRSQPLRISYSDPWHAVTQVVADALHDICSLFREARPDLLAMLDARQLAQAIYNPIANELESLGEELDDLFVRTLGLEPRHYRWLLQTRRDIAAARAMPPPLAAAATL
ncbi:hypothetical protein NUW54_g12386 [Trametes sanguinea]|uniref:Uncharacterized protein n=1 Tax=Trametes sanguinea TaxID=158606 RepID=A0ACC1MY21_9APHY|nr:hypothetical protein NUW54_g12386 [Trametes sanguinea]